MRSTAPSAEKAPDRPETEAGGRRGLRRFKRRRAEALRVLVRADRRDAYHVGGAGNAERHAGDDDDALAGADKAVAEGDAAGAADHVVLVAGVLGDHAV